MKNTLKYLFALAMAAAGTSAYAASGVIELEIPGMNEETAARIVDFRTNACPATVAALRDSIASNYDGVVLRKADKRDELQAEADALAVELEAMIATNAVQYAIRRQQTLIEERQALVDEMTDIVDDMIEYKWYRVEQNVVRFTDSRFGRKHDGNYRYNEPDADGQMKIKGGAFDEPRSQCRTEERGNGRDPSQGYHNVGFRILREKNWAASVIQNANAASWLSRNVEGGSSLTAADYKALEEDSDSDGIPTWAEYIALTDPNDAESRFSATISIGADGVPVVGWNTQTSPSRTYKVFGKVDLSDSVWLEVEDNVELYRFFKVTVEVK